MKNEHVESMDEILNELTDKSRKLLLSMMVEKLSDASLERVKRFISDYDEECAIDQIVINNIARFIDAIGCGIQEAEEKHRGKFTGNDAGKVVIGILRQEANTIEEAINRNAKSKH